jgi:lipoyl(octanoyl) transferase
MEWNIAPHLTPYPVALSHMQERAGAIADGTASEEIWLVEHPPLYTAGTSAKPEHLLHVGFPVFEIGRGGQHTYHGPGQRVIYTMLNVKARYAPNVPDVRHFVATLEQWLIDCLRECGVVGERREGRIGIWVVDGAREAKIAALGIRISRGVSLHGMAINVHPDLSHFEGIVPCGIKEHGVTSLHALGIKLSMQTVDAALWRTCPFV